MVSSNYLGFLWGLYLIAGITVKLAIAAAVVTSGALGERSQLVYNL